MTNDRFALITVSDRTGIVEFARGLRNLGFKIVASEGTAKHLKGAGVEVITAEEWTGSPPVMQPQGIKLIQQKIFGPILCDPKKSEHLEDLKHLGVPGRFEIVVCNFYPFKERKAKMRGFDEHGEIMMNIDIGGPAMIRCAAKNHENCTPIVSPEDYKRVLDDLLHQGRVGEGTSYELAVKAFEASIAHDQAILGYLNMLR